MEKKIYNELRAHKLARQRRRDQNIDPNVEDQPDSSFGEQREGLKDFSRKIKGFETGTLMGLESKTSSPIQVMREKDGRCVGFDNLFIVGEGSGFAGGIIASAADGVKCAIALC